MRNTRLFCSFNASKWHLRGTAFRTEVHLLSFTKSWKTAMPGSVCCVMRTLVPLQAALAEALIARASTCLSRAETALRAALIHAPTDGGTDPYAAPAVTPLSSARSCWRLAPIFRACRHVAKNCPAVCRLRCRRLYVLVTKSGYTIDPMMAARSSR